MDYFTYSVEKIETYEDLICDFSNKVKRETAILCSFEDLKQIDSQNFIDHTKMVPIRPFINKAI